MKSWLPLMPSTFKEQTALLARIPAKTKNVSKKENITHHYFRQHILFHEETGTLAFRLLPSTDLDDLQISQAPTLTNSTFSLKPILHTDHQ
jgi:hypothetical protein